MNLLITGGAGFIGSHFVLRHVAAHPEDKVVVVDKLTYAADRRFLAPVESAITFSATDIVDTRVMDQLVERHSIDTIVNFAAESHVDRSIDNASEFLHTNILGVQSLMDVMRKHPNVRMLHISTDEVFGDLADGEAPKDLIAPLRPSSPYAASKAAAELLILSAMRTYGLKIAVSRCTNNYGPHQASEKFVPTVIRTALADKPVPIYAQGKNKRDWLYVTDHCDALERILNIPDAFTHDDLIRRRFYHVSAGADQQNIDVAKMILKILGKSESLLTFVTDRPGHDWRYALDSSELRAHGWKPRVSFEEGLQKTVEWYKRRN